jgi:hypothetical protein
MNVSVKGLMFILFILSFNIIAAGSVKADEEPNSKFKEAEELKDGKFNGTVEIYDGYDVDYYYIKLYKNEKVEIVIGITEGAYIQVSGYSKENEPMRDINFQISGIGTHKEIEWNNEQNLDKLYFMVNGDCSYNINIKTSMNMIQGMLSNFSLQIIIVLVSIFVIIVIFIVATRTILKSIDLSVSHGFEEEEIEIKKKEKSKKKSKVKLKDKRERFLNMPIAKDKSGLERMMHHIYFR